MFYTFVISIDNKKYLKRKLETLEIFNKREIILIGKKEDKSEILNQFENIIYIENNEGKLANAYNEALKIAKGDYLNFSLATDFISKKTLKEIQKINNNKKIIGLKARSQDKISKEKNFIEIEKNLISDVHSKNALYLGGYFIPQDLSPKIMFDPNSNYYELNFIIENVIINYEALIIINRYCYYLEEPITSSKTSLALNDEWYTKDLKNYIIPLITKNPFNYVKSIALTLLIAKLKANLNSVVKCPLNDKKLEEFLDLYKDTLNLIDDEIILNSSDIKSEFKRILLFLKYDLFDKKIPLTKEGNIVKNNLIFDKPLNYSVGICAINNINDNIIFDAEYNGKVLIENGGKILVYFNDTELKINENHIYSDTKLWNKTYNKKYTFSFIIPKSTITNNSTIKFVYKYQDNLYNLKLTFNSNMPQARLTDIFPHSYWKYEKNKIITYKNNQILFKEMTSYQIFKQELSLYYDFLFKSKKRKLGLMAFCLRLLYRITRPYYKNKRIWITFDKLYKGGDNGEYFYQYMQNNKKGIRCYYIINKTAYDYQRLKHQKYILKFKTLKEYLTVLNAECIFATHAKAYNMCALTKGKEKYFRDLFNQEIFCLQHGLTIQDIAHLQHRLYDNTKLYFCASPNEIENIMQEKYDYARFDYIKETGLARYDGLKNNDEKVILITPTWRANMANTKTVIGGIRPYYSEFKNTIYYKIYNDLINNKKLIATAKKYGYKITYLVHPTLSAQINDFTKNDYVNIYTVTENQSYEKLLTTSSLMVTDYSGIQYDFAYMKKPIIYYHPEELPPHYGNGGINYETEGFGPILFNQEELVECLCEYIKNGCQTEEKYIKRSDKFFIFNDHNNCARICDETLKYMDKIKNETI